MWRAQRAKMRPGTPNPSPMAKFNALAQAGVSDHRGTVNPTVRPRRAKETPSSQTQPWEGRALYVMELCMSFPLVL